MSDEIILGVSALDVDTNGYQVSDLDDVEFYCEIDQLDADTDLRPRIGTRFPKTAFDNLEVEGSA